MSGSEEFGAGATESLLAAIEQVRRVLDEAIDRCHDDLDSTHRRAEESAEFDRSSPESDIDDQPDDRDALSDREPAGAYPEAWSDEVESAREPDDPRHRLDQLAKHLNAQLRRSTPTDPDDDGDLRTIGR